MLNEFEQALDEISPRAASVTLLLFDRVVKRYEQEKGYKLSSQERETIVSLLRYVANRDRPASRLS